MIIRAHQIAQLTAHTEKAFRLRVMKLIVEQKMAEPTDARLEPICAALIQQARAYGFTTELEVATFTLCGFRYGLDFHANSSLPFHGLLIDSRTDVATKTDMIIEFLEKTETSTIESKEA